MNLVQLSLLQFLDIIFYMVLVRAVLSWFVRDLSNPIVRFLYEVTEPLLVPFRNLQNKLGIDFGLDFSPILLFLVIEMLKRFIIVYL